MTDIAGIFDSKMQANQAVSELLDAGFKKENINLIASDNAHHSIFVSPMDDVNACSAKGSFAGALIGGTLGAIVASITAVHLYIPGIGHVGGQVVAIIAGACVGVAAGGLSGALVGAGLGADAARKYKKAI